MIIIYILAGFGAFYLIALIGSFINCFRKNPLLLLLIVPLFLLGCTCHKYIDYSDGQYLKRQYEEIIQRDSVICEDFISGKIDKNAVQVLLKMQHDNTESLRTLFE